MLKLIKRRSGKIGLPPGTLTHIGRTQERKVNLSVIDYDEEHFEEKIVTSIDECFLFKTAQR